MNKVLDFFKVLIFPLGAFLAFPLIISTFNLFGLQINKVVLTVISSLIMLISGFLIGKKSTKKGYVSGAILGLIFILFLMFIGLFWGIKFSFGRIIYYLILILCAILGSIIGINKKKSN